MIESRTRNKVTGVVVVTGTYEGRGFVVRLAGSLLDLATDPEYYLASAVRRSLEEDWRIKK